jgi:hypothetical protein
MQAVLSTPDRRRPATALAASLAGLGRLASELATWLSRPAGDGSRIATGSAARPVTRREVDQALRNDDRRDNAFGGLDWILSAYCPAAAAVSRSRPG